MSWRMCVSWEEGTTNYDDYEDNREEEVGVWGIVRQNDPGERV